MTKDEWHWHVWNAGDDPGAIPPRFDPSKWNGWRLEGDELGYPAYGPGAFYWLDLCGSSAGVLDRIMQVTKKTWATDQCIAGLVRAFNDILNPQANLCSGGGDKRLTEAKLGALVRDAKSAS